MHDLRPIVELIKSNRISSVEVADALGKKNTLSNIYALNKGHHVVGPVTYIPAFHESNWNVHDQIRYAEKGQIIYIDTFDCNDRAIIGDIISKYLFFYKQVTAVVINGKIRDVHRLISNNYPIWCLGTTPLGCYNRDVAPTQDCLSYIHSNSSIFLNSVIVADDSGVTLIPNDIHLPSFLSALDNIELQEDIWYYCLDTLKMNTYDIICKKSYLSSNDLLPSALLKRLNND